MKTISNDIFFLQVESEISEGRSVRFRVKGNSMYPLLRNNKDEVTVAPSSNVPKAMDIVLFRYKGKHILHRIIGTDGTRYIIQGDGIYTNKEQCTIEDIVGVVTIIHKNGVGQLDTSSRFFKFCSTLWYYFRFLRRYLLRALRFVYPY